MNEIEQIIEHLNLQPHPEGGYFKETYRSDSIIDQSQLNSNFSGDRNFSTAIYFLLTSDSFSAFHRIKQDEMWHYYKGSPLELHIISKEGVYSKIKIGNDFEKGEVPQYVVKGGDYFAANVFNKNDYTLVGCTVSPGFDFMDFEMPNKEELLKIFPDCSAIIDKLSN